MDHYCTSFPILPFPSKLFCLHILWSSLLTIGGKGIPPPSFHTANSLHVHAAHIMLRVWHTYTSLDAQSHCHPIELTALSNAMHAYFTEAKKGHSILPFCRSPGVCTHKFVRHMELEKGHSILLVMPSTPKTGLKLNTCQEGLEH